MRDLEKCKAEIFRRSEEKLNKQKKTRNRILSLCIPLCLFIILAAVPIVPAMFGTQPEASDVSQSESSYSYDNDESNDWVGGGLYGDGGHWGSATSSSKQPATSLTDGMKPNKINATVNLADKNAAVTDFAVRLFKECNENDKNTLISPLSVLVALGMTANGAENETLEQIESVFGITYEDLNMYLHTYMNSLPQGEKYKLSLANSIWFTDDERFAVNHDFLQATVDYYGADIYKAPFNNDTCKDINDWVNDKTDGMIPEILKEIPSNAIMYLVNALAFEAEWENGYSKYSVREGVFAKEDGTTQNVEFMHGEENNYLEDDKATGFIKYYKDKKYAFVALLPKEGVTVEEYVSSLNGEKLNALLSNPQNDTVSTLIPKFETEYDVEMSGILAKMGMPKAFAESFAELGKLGVAGNNLFIGSVIHKTFISVGEEGTKAGAATAVEILTESAPRFQVNLDRPFVYMLIDCENNIPFFIGTTLEIN